jgi:hypothetical protein
MSETVEPPKPVKAHCPTCDGDRSCSLHGKVYVPWEWSDNRGNGMNGGTTHSLFQCLGCEAVFYEESKWDSESLDYDYDHEGNTVTTAIKSKNTYPKPQSKTRPKWVDDIDDRDEQLVRILNEMYVAFDNESFILASIGLRTALDRSTEVLGIDAGLPFVKKLDALQHGGWIGDTEREILGVVTDAGSAAAHRGWSPDRAELAPLISALELFLQKAFIAGKRALHLKAKIPGKRPLPVK